MKRSPTERGRCLTGKTTAKQRGKEEDNTVAYTGKAIAALIGAVQALAAHLPCERQVHAEGLRAEPFAVF